MAYQDVKVPRFFINDVLFNITNGIDVSPLEDLAAEGTIDAGNFSSFNFYLNPTAPSLIPANTHTRTIVPINYRYNYIMYLGHTFRSNDIKAWISDGQITEINGDEGNVNMPYAPSGNSPDYDGWSLHLFPDQLLTSDAIIHFENKSDTDAKINAISMGFTYTLPHSPDLNLTLEYQTGTKTIETRGGASLSNTMWSPPMWGDLGAWELNDPSNETTGQALAHSSRRVFNLSFSFLAKENILPKYNALNRYANNEDLSDSDLLLTNDETLLDSDDFFSRVFNIVGTSLPFIFQPDKDTFEFAICKFQKSLSFQQTLPGFYSCKMKIREVW